MRTRLSGLILVSVALLGLGCASGSRSRPDASQNAPSSATLTKMCVMKSGGRDVLRITLPADATCNAQDGALQTKAHNRYVELWLVRDAKSVDEAVGRAGQVIQTEFRDFKATDTSPMVVAGSAAKRLSGDGTEADDGDPGHADVVVFTVGGRVFVACAHGESLSPQDQQWLTKVVESAQAP